MKRIRILLAEDHTILRQGLKRILSEHPEIHVVAEASNGREAVRLAAELRPDIVIMDVAMPELNGLVATRQIMQLLPDAKILALSMYDDVTYVREIIQAGAKGYLVKDIVDSELINAIIALQQGNLFFSAKVGDLVREIPHTRNKEVDRSELLTNREREILELIAKGKSSKEIAEQLFLSVYTVDTHRKHIMEKLDLHSVSEIIHYAIRKGIIPV